MKSLFRCLILVVIVFSFHYSYSYALTTEQVLQLKKAGVDDQTIRLMMKQEEEGRINPEDRIGTREVRDKDGNTMTVYSTGKSSSSGAAQDTEQEKVDKAWKMLQNMIIDRRTN
jgi:hypothetical protein